MRFLLRFIFLCIATLIYGNDVASFTLDTSRLHRLTIESSNPTLRQDTISRFSLDTTQMPLNERFYFDNLPLLAINSRPINSFYLPKAIHYTTSISETEIPEDLTATAKLLMAKNIHLFRLKHLQIKLVQILLANGFPIILDMNRITFVQGKNSDNLLRTTSQGYYNVVKGFSPIDPSIRASLEKGQKTDEIVFFLYDGYGFAGNLKDTLNSSIRSLLPIIDGQQTAARSQAFRTNDIFVVTPKEIDSLVLRKILLTILDNMSSNYRTLDFGYYLPEIEEVKYDTSITPDTIKSISFISATVGVSPISVLPLTSNNPGFALDITLARQVNTNIALGIQPGYYRWSLAESDSTRTLSYLSILTTIRIKSHLNSYRFFIQQGLGYAYEKRELSTHGKYFNASINNLLISMEAGTNIKRVEPKLGLKFAVSKNEFASWFHASIGFHFKTPELGQ